MQIQLNHQQVLDLRAYINVADVLQQLFAAEKMPVQLQGGIDDEHCTIVLLVEASPEAAVALLNARGVRYMTMDYHSDDARTVATYKAEFLHHEVMVVATELHAAAVVVVAGVDVQKDRFAIQIFGGQTEIVAVPA